MSDCSRCSANNSIRRHGENNVIEIEFPGGLGSGEFKFYKKVHGTLASWENTVIYKREVYVWYMSVFSEEHSLDEDCYCGSNLKLGFAKTRIKHNDPDLVL